MQNWPLLITSIIKNNAIVLGGELIHRVYFLFLFFFIFQIFSFFSVFQMSMCHSLNQKKKDKYSFQCTGKTKQRHQCFDLNWN